jgi:hypothetical protein
VVSIPYSVGIAHVFLSEKRYKVTGFRCQVFGSNDLLVLIRELSIAEISFVS